MATELYSFYRPSAVAIQNESASDSSRLCRQTGTWTPSLSYVRRASWAPPLLSRKNPAKDGKIRNPRTTTIGAQANLRLAHVADQGGAGSKQNERAPKLPANLHLLCTCIFVGNDSKRLPVAANGLRNRQRVNPQGPRSWTKRWAR